MKERIDRQGDENLYQPKIHSKRIRDLHKLSERSGLPMTVLVDTAIQDLLEKNDNSHGVVYDDNGIDRGELRTFIAHAYQKGYGDCMRYIWLNVVDPLLGINIALNRGERKEATEQLRTLDVWIKEHLNLHGGNERNREGITKRD